MMDNKKIISVSFLIIALAIAYYLVIFLPQKEAQRLDAEKEEKLVEAQIFSDCTSKAEQQAVSLLIEKSQLAGGHVYKEGVEKGLYLSDDYEIAYERCLQSRGMNSKP